MADETPTTDPKNDFDGLLDAVKQTVATELTTALGSVDQKITGIKDELEAENETLKQGLKDAQELAAKNAEASEAHKAAAAQLFGGGAPGIRTGENSMSSRGYSYAKAMGVRQGYLSRDEAKYEMEIHDKLHKHYVVDGGMVLAGGGQSILVPLGAEHLNAEGAPELANELRQSIRQSVMGADPDQLRWMAQRFGGSVMQALSQFDDTAGGVMLGSIAQGELIDLIRAKEVMSRAGATEITLPPNGRIQFPRQTGAATAYWVGESVSITESEPSTGDLSLIAKKLAALVKLPNELLRFTTPSIEAFIRNDMARVIALKADAAALEGAASGSRPGGILDTAGVLTHTASTTDTDGDSFEPVDPGLMISRVEQADHDVNGFAWVMRPEMWWDILNSRADAVSSGDEAGAFLFSTNRDDIANGAPGRMLGYPVVTSTQVGATRSKGSGTDLSYILGGVFNEFLIGRVGVMEFATSTQGDTAFTTDQTWVRAIQHMDFAPRHTNAFVYCDDLVRPAV